MASTIFTSVARNEKNVRKNDQEHHCSIKVLKIKKISDYVSLEVKLCAC